jgi:hypothetical protein
MKYKESRRKILTQLGFLSLGAILPRCSKRQILPPCDCIGPSLLAANPSSPYCIADAANSPYHFTIEQRSTTPLLKADKPWESSSILYATVIYNGRIWQMWYEALSKQSHGDFSSMLCYAESTDGMSWKKPNLGLVRYNHHSNNNILMMGDNMNGLHGVCIFMDPLAAEGEKYKMVYTTPHNLDHGWLYGAVSKNGIYWNHIGCLQKFPADSQPVCFYDKDYYKIYGRILTSDQKRMVGYSESRNFGKECFTKPVAILAASETDGLDTDFYNNATCRITNDLYLMFPSLYAQNDDSVIPYLAYSTNGLDFCRYGKEPVIKLGQTFDRLSIYVCPGAIPAKEPNTYWIYYFGTNSGHINTMATDNYSGGIGRFLLRIA